MGAIEPVRNRDTLKGIMPRKRRATTRRHGDGRKAVLLAATTIVAHLTYLPNGFAWLDHGDVILGNAILPLTEIFDAFSRPFSLTGFYRPLVTASLSLDHALYGDWAAGYHLTNLVIHVSAVLALFWLLQELFSVSAWHAFMGSLVAAVHPATSLSVGAISYRPDPLAALFTLLGLVAMVRFLRGGRLGALACSALAYLLALLSKETALVWFPGLAFLSALTILGGERSRRRWAYAFGVLFVVSAVFLIARTEVLGGIWHLPPRSLSLSEAVGTRLRALGRLLRYLLSPTTPPLSDAIPVTRFTDPASLAAVAAVGALLGVLIALRFRARPAFVTGFLAIALLQVLSPLSLPRMVSPHYAYLAVFGLSALVALLPAQWAVRAGGRSLSWAMSPIYLWLVLGTISTAAFGAHFEDDLRLFSPEVARDPDYREGHFYLASHAFFRGAYDQAEDEYEKALDADPDVIAYVDRPAALVNLAGIDLARGRLDEAESKLVQALAGSSPAVRPGIVYNLALVARERGDFGDVISILESEDEALAPEALLLLAYAYLESGATSEAERLLERVAPSLSTQTQLEIFHDLTDRLERQKADPNSARGD